jgi:hypothetical protein
MRWYNNRQLNHGVEKINPGVTIKLQTKRVSGLTFRTLPIVTADEEHNRAAFAGLGAWRWRECGGAEDFVRRGGATGAQCSGQDFFDKTGDFAKIAVANATLSMRRDRATNPPDLQTRLNWEEELRCGSDE